MMSITNKGKLGSIEKMDTDHPIMYINFDQGRLKLTGHKKVPAQRMMTMQCKKEGAMVLEDVFQQVVVFADWQWVGKAEDNPKESSLDIPKELLQGEKL